MKDRALSIILDKKKKEVEAHALEVAQLISKKKVLEDQIQTLISYLSSVREKASAKYSECIYGDQIRNQLGFSQKIEEGINQQRVKLEIISKQLVFSQQKWNESIIERRKYEKLSEKVSIAKVAKENKTEQKEIDEFAMRFAYRSLNINR